MNCLFVCHHRHTKQKTFHICTILVCRASFHERPTNCILTLFDLHNKHTHTQNTLRQILAVKRLSEWLRQNCTSKRLSAWSRARAVTCHQPVCPRALLCNCAFEMAVVIVVVVQKERRMNGQIWALWSAT